MPTCRGCGKQFSNLVWIDGKQRNVSSRKFCLECSPFGQHNTKPSLDDNSKVITCSSCGREYTYSSNSGCTKTRCNSCMLEANRSRKREMAIEYKSGACAVCGYNKCHAALDFHHLDPSKKNFSISKSYYLSWEELKAELDKCVLLCKNCHSELHVGLLTL